MKAFLAIGIIVAVAAFVFMRMRQPKVQVELEVGDEEGAVPGVEAAVAER